jgi:hypothetical protein
MSIISAGGAVTGADVGGPIDPRDYFNTLTYTADGTSPKSRTGVGFAPDFLWFKDRDVTFSHALYDIVRGTNKGLQSNTTAAGNTYTLLSTFGSDGFTTTTDGTVGNLLNNSTDDYVVWAWKGGGAGSSNSDGGITSTVSASTDSGFSIVTWTGQSSGTATIGHGLGVAPDMVIMKISSGSTSDWEVYHKNLTSAAYSIRLQSPLTEASRAGVWDSTAPTPTRFSVGASYASGGAGYGMVAYCFAEISGFSKIGSYTGNGSPTGPTITTDFQPSWLMIKRRNDTGNWIIHDSARDATNPRTAYLEPNTSAIEQSGLDVDFNATGFQIKSSSATVNADTEIYIYMCIA